MCERFRDDSGDWLLTEPRTQDVLGLLSQRGHVNQVPLVRANWPSQPVRCFITSHEKKKMSGHWENVHELSLDALIWACCAGGKEGMRMEDIVIVRVCIGPTDFTHPPLAGAGV